MYPWMEISKDPWVWSPILVALKYQITYLLKLKDVVNQNNKNLTYQYSGQVAVMTLKL